MIRIIQSVKLHLTIGQGKMFSKPKLRAIAVMFSIGTIIASFCHGIYGTQQTLTFWIVIGLMATITRTNSEIRADWGMFSFSEESCFLRPNRTFRDSAYIICMILVPILDVAWVLTISNNTAPFLGINVLYFFLMLSYIELCRRGMWMVFRIEDDHSLNVLNLKAMANDSHIR